MKGASGAIAPLAPFTHFFTDDAFNAQYDGERRFSKLFISLVFMAIIISCLGLFGLAVYDTTQRKKEIAVRKILGSSSFNILTMLMKDFLLLVVIGIFLGAPIGWYIMEQWLQEFAYRVDLNPGTFLFASFILIIIAIATIGYQTIKVAHADPAMSLKTAN